MTHQTFSTETYILPAHWASALINDDYTGYSDAEHSEISNWLFANKEHLGSCIDVSEDNWFAPSNDAHTLACDVATFTFRKD
jgi:hypothetical protein